MKPKHFISLVVLVFGVMFLYIAKFIINDDYYMINLMRQKYHVISTEKKVSKRTAYDTIKSSDSTSITDDSSNLQHSDATTGTGLNLLLMDSLTEGYVKEMLTLFRASSNGELDDKGFHVPVGALCGIQSCETGWYSGTHLLKSYLPYANGKVVWNEAYLGAAASDMTLSKFDNTVVNKLGINAINNSFDSNYTTTVFQYDGWTGDNAVSKMNGSGNSGRSKGDHYYLPDVLTANNRMYSDGLKAIHLTDFDSSSVSDGFSATTYSLIHGRGAGGFIQTTFGNGYTYKGEWSYSDYIDISQLTSEELLKFYSYYPELGDNYKSNHMNNSEFFAGFKAGSEMRYVVSCIAAKTDGWYLSSSAKDYCLDSASTCIRIWNAVWPDDKIETSEELANKLDSSTKSLKDAIKEVTGKTISDTDISSVYRTNSDYDDIMPYHWGAIFHVVNEHCDAYTHKYSDGSVPFFVQSFDTVMCGEAIGANIVGDYVYAYMLYEGGMGNVDPTNPDTYLNGLSNGSTFVPQRSDISWMSAWGVDTTSLTKDRTNLLNTAYNMCQTDATYAQDSTTMNKEFDKKITPTVIDCSGFVSKVINNTGFTFQKRSTVTGIFYDRVNYEVIDHSEIKPGDIMAYLYPDGGHIMFWIGESAEYYSVIDSNSISGKQNGPKIRRVSKTFRDVGIDKDPKEDGKIYFLRIKALDTNKYTTHAQNYN